MVIVSLSGLVDRDDAVVLVADHIEKDGQEFPPQFGTLDTWQGSDPSHVHRGVAVFRLVTIDE